MIGSYRRYLAGLGILIFLSGLTSLPLRGGSLDALGDVVGGACYVMAIAWLLSLARPTTRPVAAAWFAFVATCLIELLQLVRSPLLEQLRQLPILRVALGSVFSWHDFPPYGLGAVLIYLALRWGQTRYLTT